MKILKEQTPDKNKPTRRSLEEIQHAADIAEKLTVLAQPHRKGEEGDMTCALGTFVRYQCKHTLADGRVMVDRRFYEAGQKYILLVAKWRRAKGIPQTVFIADETRSGGGTECDLTGDEASACRSSTHAVCACREAEEAVDEWGRQIQRCEFAMKCSGLPGFRACNSMILDDKPPPEEQFGPVKRALFQLAICLGMFSD